MNVPSSVSWLLDNTLPLNRKERFYTGTVLPGIVCADLTQLGRLTALMGHPDVDVSGDPDDSGLLFFTEYGIAESAYGPSASRLAGLPTARDTPDIVFLATRPQPVLFALEAKMYDRPGGFALRHQLDLQLALLNPLADRLGEWLGVEEVPVAHYALLPSEQAEALHLAPHQTITWQQVRDAYADVAPAYWLQMLTEALARYDDLVTRAIHNDDDRVTGEEIVAGYHAGTLRYTAVGRSQGLLGPRLGDDIATGSWRTTKYQVATVNPGNSNWFSVEDFVAQAAPAGASSTRSAEDGPANPRTDLSKSCQIGVRLFGEGSIAQTIANAHDEAFAEVPVEELRRVADLYRAAITAGELARQQAEDVFGQIIRRS